MNQTIYLLRHGETVFNSQGRYQGELDSPLTDDGIAQVNSIARLLKMYIGDPKKWAIISSPLGRAMQSSEIICNTLGFDVTKVEKDNRLREVSVGSWAGLTMKEIEEKWPKLLKHTDHYNWFFNSPNGESYTSVEERVADWLKSIEGREKIIAVSHGLTGRILRGVYTNLEKTQALKLEVSQDIFFKLEHHNVERFSIEYDEY